MKNNLTKPLRRLFSPAFTILLALAFALWLISRLSHIYTTQIEIEVLLEVDYNAGVWVETEPSELKVLARGNGFDLLRYKIGMGKQIKVPVSDIKLDYITKGNELVAEIDDQSLINAINTKQGKFDVQMIVNALEPVGVSQITEVKLPIVPNIKYSCAKQHIIDSPLEITPDSILVKIPVMMLGKVKSISTVPLELMDLRGNRSGLLSIEMPKDVVGQTNQVKYKIGVTEYTEITQNITIKHSGNKNIVTSPGKATVRLKVPTTVSNLKVDELELVINNKPETNQSEIYRLKLKGNLSEVINYTITPEFVRVFYVD